MDYRVRRVDQRPDAWPAVQGAVSEDDEIERYLGSGMIRGTPQRPEPASWHKPDRLGAIVVHRFCDRHLSLAEQGVGFLYIGAPGRLRDAAHKAARERNQHIGAAVLTESDNLDLRDAGTVADVELPRVRRSSGTCRRQSHLIPCDQPTGSRLTCYSRHVFGALRLSQPALLSRGHEIDRPRSRTARFLPLRTQGVKHAQTVDPIIGR